MISTWVLVWTIFCAVIVYITNWLESKPSLEHCRINLCNTLLSHSLWYFSSSNWLAMIPFHSAASTSSQFSCVLNCQLFTQVITVAVILCKYSRWKLRRCGVRKPPAIRQHWSRGEHVVIVDCVGQQFDLYLCYLGSSAKKLSMQASWVQQKYITVLQSR